MRVVTLVSTLAAAMLGAVARPPPLLADEAQELRTKLLDKDESVRAAALKSLEGRPAQIGLVLGGVLRDDTLRDASVRVAGWLVDRPPLDKEPMLLDEVLRRARDDFEFARLVRLSATTTVAGWARYVEGARRRWRDAAAPVEVRRGSLQFLAADPSLASAEELAEAWAGASADEQRREARDALDGALAYRFADVEAARRWLAAHRKEPFLDAVRSLSASKDTPQYPAYLRLVTESKANLERTKTLAELAPYLRPKDTPWPEVRRLAARHGAEVGGDAGDWMPLLTVVLHDEDDHETLRYLLDVAARLGDGEGLRSPGLADAIVLRLRECCNAPPVQRGLLDLLAKAGDTGSVREARAAIGESGDPSVQEAWLRAAAAVGDLDEEICRLHQARAGREDPASISLRVRALEALGLRRGKEWARRAVARDYLYGILRRSEADAITENMPKELAPAARAAAIQSLESFPAPDTHQRLAVLAESPPEAPEHALLAVSVLAKLAAKSDDAARRLLEVSRNAKTRGDVRREALEDAAKILADGAGGPTLRPDVLAHVQALLADDAADAGLRAGAAAAAAVLAEPAALEAVASLYAALLRIDAKAEAQDAGKAIERLVRALATAEGGAHDARIASALSGLSKAGGAASGAASDAAIALADAAADAGGARLELQTLRASLRYERARPAAAGSDAVDPARRRADLEDAHRILRAALKASDGKETAASLRVAQKAQFDVATGLLADAETKNGLRRTALVAALSSATALGDASILSQARPYLEQARALSELTNEEKAVLDAYAAAATKSPPAAPR